MLAEGFLPSLCAFFFFPPLSFPVTQTHFSAHPPFPSPGRPLLSDPPHLPSLSISLPEVGTTNYDKMNRDSLDICCGLDSIEGIQSVVS